MRFAGAEVGVSASSGLLSCGGRRGVVLAALGKIEALDRRAFFVVVPGLDQDEGKRMRCVEVTSVEVKGIFEGLAAAALHVTIKSPSCG